MILIKLDMQAQVDQQRLLNVLNDTLSSRMLGQYQVDPNSIGLEGTLTFCYFCLQSSGNCTFK